MKNFPDHVSPIIFILMLPLLSLPATADPPPFPRMPPGGGPYGDESFYSMSPASTVFIIVGIGLILVACFLGVFLRHFIYAFYGGASRGRGLFSGGVSAWRLREGASAQSTGLEASVIEGLPTFKYSDVKIHRMGKGGLECAICLSEFQDHEVLRQPACNHAFHRDCIDPWLATNPTCPVCRSNLITPRPFQFAAAFFSVDTESDTSYSDRDADLEAGRSPAPETRDCSPESAGDKVKLLRSHTTGHSMASPVGGPDSERFTLRLPETVRDRAAKKWRFETGEGRAAMSAASSPRMGYRTRSVGGGGGGWPASQGVS